MKRRIALAALPLVPQACAVPQALPEATGLDGTDGEVIVIGKIELVPPIDPREQRSHWNVVGEQRMLGRIWMATGGEFRPVTTSRLDGSQFHHSLEVRWGAPFAVKAPRRRTYFNGGVTHLDALHQERLWFPGGVYFDVPAQARAVYVGTLRYHRNDFNAITRMEIVDEPGDVRAALKGADVSGVRTSLLQRLR